MKRLYRQRRITFLLFFFFVMIATMGYRVFLIQIIHGALFARASVIHRSHSFVYGTGRGQILDRFGESLLDTRNESVKVVFNFNDGSNEPEYEQESKQYVWSVEDDAKHLEDRFPHALEAYREHRYGPNSLAPHIVGYIKPVLTPKNNPLSKEVGKTMYTELSYVGEKGLERLFNQELSAARPSVLAAFIDGRGELVSGIGYRAIQFEDPRRPYNVVTTIDRRIQKIIEDIGNTRDPMNQGGAIVVMEVKSGDILAMASFPAYSSEMMFSGVRQDIYNSFDFNNRAIAGYAPGSVFKVILAAAAIETKLPEPETFICTGSYQVGNTSVSCYNNKAHGVVDLTEAFAVSCNGYFAHLALRLGKESMIEMAHRFKLGQNTNIALGNEAGGNIPESTKLPNPGDVANTSIGQGDVLTTPLQLTRVMTAIANGGVDVYPRLVSEITDKNGRIVKRYPVLRGQRILSPMVAMQLNRMLADVVNSGTARDAWSELYATFGKSGTAESPTSESNSWFAGFVQIDGRQLAITVFVEKWDKDNPNHIRAPRIFKDIAETIHALYQ